MTTADFTALKNFILEKNTYLGEGYANAFKEAESNKVFARSSSGDLIAVFPNDTLGNYFYIRHDNGLSFSANLAARATDCGPGRLGFNDTATLQIVAIVKNADAYSVIDNLRNTAMMYTGMDVIPTAAIWNREQVLLEEMSGAEGSEKQAALKRLKDETIVRVTCICGKTYTPSTCIKDPCKNC